MSINWYSLKISIETDIKNNNFFSMRSAYTNNAQVFYKPHSLASGGVGGTRNCRIKSKKT